MSGLWWIRRVPIW